MSKIQMSKEQLTKRQQELAAKNHDLIYAYAYKKNISIEDYYGTLAVGLCKAAKTFDEGKGKFSTLAYCCMENELYAQWKNAQKKSAIPENLVLSYDREDSDNQNNFLENFQDCRSYNDMMYAVILLEFTKRLTDREKTIFQFLLDGFISSEIAEKLGCKRQSVDYHIKNIRNKVFDYLYC